VSDYPVIQVDGVSETADFSVTGLPSGVRTVTLTSTSAPVKKQSIFKLVQLCILLLLRTPGRDILEPEIGGGLRLVVGKPVGPSIVPARRGEIGLAVSTTERQIIESQATANRLTPDERLSSFVLLRADFDFEEQEWLIITRVISEAGGAADVLL
jgi:hypothetical protein